MLVNIGLIHDRNYPDIPKKFHSFGAFKEQIEYSLVDVEKTLSIGWTTRRV